MQCDRGDPVVVCVVRVPAKEHVRKGNAYDFGRRSGLDLIIDRARGPLPAELAQRNREPSREPNREPNRSEC